MSIRSALAAIPEFDILPAKRPSIELDGDRRRAVFISAGPRQVVSAAGPIETDLELPSATDLADDVVRVVVADAWSADMRAAIEESGLSWCDARGAAHVTWPGMYFHVDRSRGSRQPSARRDVGTGVTTIRGVQTMLTHPEVGWSVSRLASAATLSTGQAHSILTLLESNHFLRSEGRGPKHRRFIRERDDVLTWLTEIERSRRRPTSVASYLYARTFDDLIDRFARRAAQSSITYALTGVAAAVALGHRTMTNPLVLQARVALPDPDVALAALGLEELQSEDAGRGMNVQLLADVGELGTHGSRLSPAREEPVVTAPPVRVYLDMARAGGRQADAATLFKEQALV